MKVKEDLLRESKIIELLQIGEMSKHLFTAIKWLKDQKEIYKFATHICTFGMEREVEAPCSVKDAKIFPSFDDLLKTLTSTIHKVII